MAAALTERGRSGFEIRAFDKEDPKAEDPSATLFRQIISCLGGSNRRVNIRFDSDMSIDEIRVYEVCIRYYVTRFQHNSIEHCINIQFFVQTSGYHRISDQKNQKA